MRKALVTFALVVAGCSSSSVTAKAPVVAPAPTVAVAATERILGPGDVTMGLVRDSALAAALADVSAQNIRASDSALVGFYTRNTLSDTLSASRGIGAARRWIHAQLASYSQACGGCLHVEYDAATMPVPNYQGPPVNVVNVLAWLPGRDTSRVIVIGGHYDSCICAVNAAGRFDITANAPGANDDGSGSSAVIELARVFSKHFPRGLDATIIFALYAGEEQGLLGSTHLADRLEAGGYRVVAGIADDMDGNVVAQDGYTDSTSMRIYAADPDNSPSRELGRYVWALGAIYSPRFEVMPTWRLDRIGRGGDHRPFVMKGWAGLRNTERVEDYNRQHRPTDDLAHVNFGYVANVARVNAATVGALAMAPATPDSAQARRETATSGGQSWTLTWTPVASAASYEVLVRRTTSPTWERVVPVGTATRYVLPSQLDDEWAGIRAVDANGHRSLAAVVPSSAVPARPASPGSR